MAAVASSGPQEAARERWFARVGIRFRDPDPRASKGSYLPPKKPYLTFARKAALVTRNTSTDIGVIFFKLDTSF
jgi:hypothetical protein